MWINVSRGTFEKFITNYFTIDSTFVLHVCIT